MGGGCPGCVWSEHHGKHLTLGLARWIVKHWVVIAIGIIVVVAAASGFGVAVALGWALFEDFTAAYVAGDAFELALILSKGPLIVVGLVAATALPVGLLGRRATAGW